MMMIERIEQIEQIERIEQDRPRLLSGIDVGS